MLRSHCIVMYKQCVCLSTSPRKYVGYSCYLIHFDLYSHIHQYSLLQCIQGAVLMQVAYQLTTVGQQTGGGPEANNFPP
jgi:hypothetical protein